MELIPLDADGNPVVSTSILEGSAGEARAAAAAAERNFELQLGELDDDTGLYVVCFRSPCVCPPFVSASGVFVWGSTCGDR